MIRGCSCGKLDTACKVFHCTLYAAQTLASVSEACFDAQVMKHAQ